MASFQTRGITLMARNAAGRAKEEKRNFLVLGGRARYADGADPAPEHTSLETPLNEKLLIGMRYKTYIVQSCL